MARVIITGYIAQYPLGGMAWHYLQYVLGLARLGHDVFYVEDTGLYPYSPLEKGVSKTCEYNVSFLNDLLARYQLEDRWAYKFPWESRWFGLEDQLREEVIRSADLLINVSGSLATPGDYRQIPKMVYIDTDPVFTQLKLARGQKDFQRIVEMHDLQFSFGERLAATSDIPSEFDWIPTRQPIVLSEWKDRKPVSDAYTTVMNWTSYKPITYNGKVYGQKDAEFAQFIDLPGLSPGCTFQLAINEGKTRRTPRKLLKRNGWQLVDPDEICPDLDSYRSYIETSRAEWTVAKNGYVTGQSGWFSERSACYLASGKPVITQDTGFSAILPCGEGLLPFRTLDESLACIESVETNYAKHAHAAAELAQEYFSAEKTLTALLERTFSSVALRRPDETEREP